MKTILTLFLCLVCALLLSVTTFAKPLPSPGFESQIPNLKSQLPNQNSNPIKNLDPAEKAIYGDKEAIRQNDNLRLGVTLADRKLTLISANSRSRRMNFTEYYALLNERKILKFKPKLVPVLNLKSIPF